MLGQQTMFRALIVSLLITIGRTKITLPNCSCGALSTFYVDYRFGCECFRKQPMTNQSVFPASSLPVNLTSLYLGIPDQDWESFRSPSCQASNRLYSYLGADTMRLWTGTDLKFIGFNNFDFTKSRAKRISPWLENVKGTLVEMEIICGKLVTLSTGVFVGFSKLAKLTITGSYLQNIEAGAFSELGTAEKSTLTNLDLSFNSVSQVDWAMMHPFASSLQSFVMTSNALYSMQASLKPFPELRRIDLAANYLVTIPESVVKTWPKSDHFAVNLKRNPLCPSDSLCRCCSLFPLFQFANESGNTWISIECGNLDSEMILNETFFASVSQTLQTPLCTNKYLTRVTVGDLTEAGNMSQFDHCVEDDEANVEMTLCTVPAPASSSLKSLGQRTSRPIGFVLVMLLTMMLFD